LPVDLCIKRDDLYPFTGGGNKARKIVHIFKAAAAQDCDAVVTTGGSQSNHARVTALAAAERGWRCRLILHGDPAQLSRPRGNLLLMLLAGAEIQFTEPDCIGPNMDRAMEELYEEGYKPYYIPGGGHSVLGALAYAEAVQELQEQCREQQWQPDWLVLAIGTGTTQAGLIVGLEGLGWPTRVVGVSVARQNPRAKRIVEKACFELRQHLDLPQMSLEQVDVRDDWVGEGYEQADDSVLSTVRMVAKEAGLILDPTYTGKAFCALLDLVDEGEIAEGAKVLFWHTGGLMNLLASDYAIMEGNR
jgi:1-aminocyclopropane-1-carboxylate deaminase/D-cysteine desulfhydrase-like pyridoxal-dependent ACC family enzyme